MGVMLDSLRLAFPKGRSLDAVRASPLTALASELERIRALIRTIPLEANPGTATETLAEWHDALGKRYNSTLPIAEQRLRLESVRLAIGGMTLRQLQTQIDKEFSGVTIAEVSASAECGLDECGVAYTRGVEGDYSPTFYDVTGTLDNDEQANHLAAVLERFAQTHLVPCSNLIILSASPTCEAGIATCGIEEAGYTA